MIAEAADQIDAVLRKGNELARPLQRAVRDLMWERCGVLRDAAGLERGLEELKAIADGAADVDVSPNEEGWADLGHLFDLRAAITTADLTFRGALARNESRGAHQRSDRPLVDPSLSVAFETRRGPDGAVVQTAAPLPRVPERLRARSDAPSPELAGDRLLE